LDYRRYGDNGPQTLSLSDINVLCEMSELSNAERRWFLEVISYLDPLYVKDIQDKLKIERSRSENKPGPRNGRAAKN
jgi:hypothetical protein